MINHVKCDDDVWTYTNQKCSSWCHELFWFEISQTVRHNCDITLVSFYFTSHFRLLFTNSIFPSYLTAAGVWLIEYFWKIIKSSINQKNIRLHVSIPYSFGACSKINELPLVVLSKRYERIFPFALVIEFSIIIKHEGYKNIKVIITQNKKSRKNDLEVQETDREKVLI